MKDEDRHPVTGTWPQMTWTSDPYNSLDWRGVADVMRRLDAVEQGLIAMVQERLGRIEKLESEVAVLRAEAHFHGPNSIMAIIDGDSSDA